MTIKQAEHNKPRIRTLDSLRGFAALSVVFGHLLEGRFPATWLNVPFFNILTYGHGAVIFFFVLSGYVLVHQYGSNPSYTYGKFIVQRVIRIYVPYFAALLLALVLFLLCEHNHYEQAWLSKVWPIPLTPKLFVEHVLLIGNFDTDALLAPMWSLVHEMRVSFLFPLLLFILRLKPLKAFIGGVLLFCVAFGSIALHIDEPLGYYNAYTYTLYYLVVFLAGGAVAIYQQPMVARYNKLTPVYKVLIVVAALLLYNYANIIFPLFFTPAQMPLSLYHYGTSITEDAIITLTSCIFIIAAISVAGKKSIIEQKLPVFLGKISFSLYLVHTPVAAFIYYSLYGKMATALIIAICFIAAIVVAVLFNKYIEVTSMKFIKRVLLKEQKSKMNLSQPL